MLIHSTEFIIKGIMGTQKIIKIDSISTDAGNIILKPEKNSSSIRTSNKIRKDITICFRTRFDVRSYLDTIALQTRQSLSYVIESIIYQHQQGKNSHTSRPIATERRRYNRKSVDLPALICDSQLQDIGYDSGTVLNISLGGIRFVIPKKTNQPSFHSENPSEYNVIFTLPDLHRSVSVRCRPQNISDTPDEYHIGATFVDADFNSYQNIQNFLI